jgi:FKBP-type peptidyl-prolyl cis-trans isomerase
MLAATSCGLMVSLCLAQDPKTATKSATTKPAATAPAAPKVAGLETVAQKASYGYGYSLGRSFQSQGAAVDAEQLIKGLRDGLAAAKTAIPEEDLRAAIQAFEQEFAAKQAALAKEEAAKNLKEGQAFLAANAKKPGVQATKSGLQYRTITPGTGATPAASDVVKVHYKGTLTDGKVFDSSIERGEPATFQVQDVIPGWVEVLQLMKVGQKVEAVIPAALAYGENPQPGSPIPPNAVLVFEIELLGIEKPAAAATKPAAP